MAKRKALIAEPLGLTEAQRQAVDLLTLGRSAGDVAQAVGTTSAELALWRQSPVFVAAVNAQLQDARENTRQRLRGLAGHALDVVEAALTEASTPAEIRLKLALKVLDLVGAGDLARANIGSADPADVETEQRHDSFMKELSRGAY